MMRYALVICSMLFAAFLAPIVAHGQTTISLVRNRANVGFPREITFTVEVAAEQPVAATLRYGTDGETCQGSGAFQRVPAAADCATFSWTWDLVRYGTLPSCRFSTIS